MTVFGRDVVRLWELVVFKSLMNLRSEAAKTYLSFAWWIVEPVLSMAVYFVVFGVLLQRGTEDFVVFLLIGLVTWQWFANTVSHGMSAIANSGRIILHVDIPKVVFPAIEIYTDLIKFSMVFALLLAFLWLSGFAPSLHYLALLPLLATQLALTIAITLALAAVVPMIPDLKPLVAVLLHLAFFLSGILYDPSMIPAEYQDLFLLNPMAALITSYRDVLMHGNWPDWFLVGRVAIASVAACAAVGWLFGRLDRLYPRIVQP